MQISARGMTKSFVEGMRSCDGSTAFKRLLFDTSAKFSAVLRYVGNTHLVQALENIDAEQAALVHFKRKKLN